MAVGRPRNRSLALAILLSVVAHFVVLLGPAWRLPTDEAAVLPPLDARLAAPPKPDVRPPDDEKRAVLGDAPPPRPLPRPRKPARPPAHPSAAPSVATDATKAEPSPGTAQEGGGETTDDKAQVDGAQAPEPAAGSPPAADGKDASGEGGKPAGRRFGETWAASGKVQYDVIRGERNFVIGRTTHAWTHDAERYSMETVIETSGLIALVKPFRMVQRSEGRVGPRGLLPERFTVERDGRLKERADFDWSSAKVVLVAGERRREFSIAEGDQDVLSLMHHLALQPDGPLRAELLVVTGKSAVRSTIENLGLEELDIPAGKVSAYHLGSTGHRGELKIDIWLARDYANLPVRLKITDKGGDVLDQVATGVDLGPQSEQR